MITADSSNNFSDSISFFLEAEIWLVLLYGFLNSIVYLGKLLMLTGAYFYFKKYGGLDAVEYTD